MEIKNFAYNFFALQLKLRTRTQFLSYKLSTKLLIPKAIQNEPCSSLDHYCTLIFYLFSIFLDFSYFFLFQVVLILEDFNNLNKLYYKLM